MLAPDARVGNRNARLLALQACLCETETSCFRFWGILCLRCGATGVAPPATPPREATVSRKLLVTILYHQPVSG